MRRLNYGIVENKGDGIFLQLDKNNGFKTFKEAVEERKKQTLFRDKKNIFIIQRCEE